MTFSAETLLAQLLDAPHRRTEEAPKDARGLYGLVDHLGELRYIGSTSSRGQTLYSRIHAKHRTGSEHLSHYFSTMYNTGRMWRQRRNPATNADGAIAKKLRNIFIARHCRAVWVVLPDSADIARLEAEVIRIAPEQATLWNGRKAAIYDEPEALVDETIRFLGWGDQEVASLERQRERARWAQMASVGQTATQALAIEVPSFPKGPFRFCALDVETANHDRDSICQIGVAFVRHDNSILTWKTYVDPQVDRWVFTGLHGISAQTVAGAPTFAEVMVLLRKALQGLTVYQHSNFDCSAITAACEKAMMSPPSWDWQDSVQVARRAWPELRGNGGHGLANLKAVLSLSFQHHDAGDDARAAAEVVLLAEQVGQVAPSCKSNSQMNIPSISSAASGAPVPRRKISGNAILGEVMITQGNINNSHIYLNKIFELFPEDAMGGSNRASVAERQIYVDIDGQMPVMTDLDGTKKIFRDRSLAREFFKHYGAKPGDFAVVKQLAPYQYSLSLRRP